LVGGETSDAKEGGMGFWVLGAGEDHSVVEDYRTQRQGSSFLKGVYVGKDASSYCA
jgi:hypothetical protein